MVECCFLADRLKRERFVPKTRQPRIITRPLIYLSCEAASHPLPRCLRADLEKVLIHRNAVGSVGRGEVGVDISFHVLTGGGVIDVQ